MSVNRTQQILGAIGVVTLCFGAAPAYAGLTLTAAGIADGFTLSTFADGFSDNNANGTGVGPIGVGFLPGGGTVVTSYATNTTVSFPSDTDGQTVSGTGTTHSGFSRPAGAATVGGVVYVANQADGTIASLNSDGSFHQTVASGLGAATGLVANPATGHLFVSNVGNQIFEVNPLNGNVTTALSGYIVDGLSLSPDGSTLFFESGGHIFGLTLSTSAITDYGSVSGADGAAVASGTLGGNIFVDTNFGQLVEINQSTLAQTVIADGGSRGDLVTVDPNGTLLLSQSNSIVRLTPPAGTTFAVPEPACLGLFAAGSALIGAIRRRKRSA